MAENTLMELAESKVEQEAAARNSQARADDVTRQWREDTLQEGMEGVSNSMVESIGSRRATREDPAAAWTLTTSKNMYDDPENPDAIRFSVNPSGYSFDLPFRQTVTQSRGGPIIHVFRDHSSDRGTTNMGFGSLSIDFQSGNILPVANKKYSQYSSGSKEFVGVPMGLRNYYKYLDIVDQDNVYQDKDGNVFENYRILTIHTRVFPSLTLYGYFQDKVGVEEKADNPNEISWTGNFQIVKTTPHITGAGLARTLASAWKSEMDAMDE